MQCPLCSQDMQVLKEDKSYSHKNNNKPYQRKLYVCRADDVWITAEIPEQQRTAQQNIPTINA